MQILIWVDVKMPKSKLPYLNPLKQIFKKINCVVPISNLHSS